MKITDKFVFFWDGFLSQWDPCTFVINKIQYNCSEQFMMAMKAQHFGDNTRLQLIMEAKSPYLQKRLGRQVAVFDVAKWDAVSRGYVYIGNMAKFEQNDDLMVSLIETDGKILVEASPYDKIWGIGMDENHPDAEDPSKWQGKNWLGEVLMEVRAELKKKYI